MLSIIAMRISLAACLSAVLSMKLLPARAPTKDFHKTTAIPANRERRGNPEEVIEVANKFSKTDLEKIVADQIEGLCSLIKNDSSHSTEELIGLHLRLESSIRLYTSFFVNDSE